MALNTFDLAFFIQKRFKPEKSFLELHKPMSQREKILNYLQVMEISNITWPNFDVAKNLDVDKVISIVYSNFQIYKEAAKTDEEKKIRKEMNIEFSFLI